MKLLMKVIYSLLTVAAGAAFLLYVFPAILLVTPLITFLLVLHEIGSEAVRFAVRLKENGV